MEEKKSFTAESERTFFSRIRGIFSSKKALVIFAVFFLAALSLAGIFYYYRQNSPQPSISTQELAEDLGSVEPTEPLDTPTSEPTVGESTSSADLQEMQVSDSCSYSCVELVAYNIDWVRVPSADLNDMGAPQDIYYVVKGETSCSDGLTQARLKFKNESEEDWRYSDNNTPQSVREEMGCDGETYFCFSWLIPASEFSAGECYDAESEVCVGEACR